MKIRIDPVPMFLDASNTVSNLLLHCNCFKQNGVKFHHHRVIEAVVVVFCLVHESK